MHGGIDLKLLDGNLKTIQIKPFKEFEGVDEKIKVMGTGNVKDYKTDLMVFHNDKNGILVFDNNETEISTVFIISIVRINYNLLSNMIFINKDHVNN